MRYGDEDLDALDGDATNADCADCGTSYFRSGHDRCVWCGPCAQRRDAWVTAFELRRMAKAVLSIDLSTVREVA
jgi:hypothetical protein